MPHVTFTAPVDTGASRIWAILSAFGHIADWHPDIRDSRIVNGLAETTPGAVRHLNLQDGGIIEEELLTLEPTSMTLSYRFTLSPLPWDNYVCLIKVEEQENATGVIDTLVTWSASFDVQESGKDAENEVLLRQMILTGYNGLRTFCSLNERTGRAG